MSTIVHSKTQVVITRYAKNNITAILNDTIGITSYNGMEWSDGCCVCCTTRHDSSCCKCHIKTIINTVWSSVSANLIQFIYSLAHSSRWIVALCLSQNAPSWLRQSSL
ncbi:hypothetical protein QVD99_000004 [Batrachochytrium dendrobatidis]|nr:hypothetical protein QVD99_000004 [Batrachochytrium dendrobatidis]